MIELINKIIKEYDLPKRDNVTSENIELKMIDAFMDFGKQVCELQKKECEEFVCWNGYDIELGKVNITDCKNVCTT